VDGRLRRRPGTLRQEACRDRVIGFMIAVGKAVLEFTAASLDLQISA